MVTTDAGSSDTPQPISGCRLRPPLGISKTLT
jgi:hypothetical protein